MNKVMFYSLIIGLSLIGLFGLTTMQTKIELQRMKENPLRQEKKISYGEGEYKKALSSWMQKDQIFFDRIMRAASYHNEIALIREYKTLVNELERHRQEINHIEPPANQSEMHHQLIQMNEYAYLSCLYYWQDTQKSHYYFKKYVSAYYQNYFTKQLPAKS